MNRSSDDSPGYVTDVAYRSDFVAAQAPILLSYVAASAGWAPPDPAGPFRYVELGCGAGATLNALAAACPHGEFVGVDFNAASIAAARAQAAAAVLANVSYIEAPFSALDPRALAPADYLACSGTYSWLDSAEKAALVESLRVALRPGGLFFVSFVTLGRAAITPMWHVLRRLLPADRQDSLARVTAGIDLLAELRDGGAAYLQQNAQALDLVNDVQRQRQAHDTAALENLAHNLFAEGLRVELLDEMVAALGPAGLAFCGSATPFLNDPDLAVPAGLRARHDAMPSRLAQELLKDFMRATRVRADVFIRAAAPDGRAAERFLAEKVQAVLTADRDETWRQLERPGWTTFDFARPAIRHVFERIAAGTGSLVEISRDAGFAGKQLRDAFGKLLASPGIELGLPGVGANPEAGAATTISPSCRYNELALDAARAGAFRVQLAAPALGSCMPVTLPGSLLLSELCRAGLRESAGTLHERLRAHVAVMPGVSPAAVAQFSDPQFFTRLHAAIVSRALPTLLRAGALRAG